jgi:hypothetical protein
LFRNLVRHRGLWFRSFSGSRFRMALLSSRRTTRWAERSGGPASHPLFFVYETPYGTHQVRHGDVNAPLPENLRDPVDAKAATMRFQDLFLVLPQGVDLGLLAITAAFRAAGDLKKILGSGFEMIRISQCESPRVFRIYDKEMANWRSNSGSQYRSCFAINIQKVLVPGFERNIGSLAPDMILVKTPGTARSSVGTGP